MSQGDSAVISYCTGVRFHMPIADVSRRELTSVEATRKYLL